MLLPLLTLASCIQQQEESKFNGFVVADYNLCLYYRPDSFVYVKELINVVNNFPFCQLAIPKISSCSKKSS